MSEAIHNPETHKHFNVSYDVGKKVQVYRCLADGCSYTDERPTRLPLVIGMSKINKRTP